MKQTFWTQRRPILVALTEGGFWMTWSDWVASSFTELHTMVWADGYVYDATLARLGYSQSRRLSRRQIFIAFANAMVQVR